MAANTYLDWVIRNTRTQWWHDSAEAASWISAWSAAPSVSQRWKKAPGTGGS